MLSESWIITYLQQAAPSLPSGMMGIGDDAAVIPLTDDTCFVVTKDLLVENVHFRTSYFDPGSIAHKSLHVNLSDLAAMGVRGQMVFLGISLPLSLSHAWVKDFLDQFIATCFANNLLLLGGDTTASGGGIGISVTMIGQAHTTFLKKRNGAKLGDQIAVVGPLGHAYLGLRLLETHKEGFVDLKTHLLRPQAKVEEGLWLAKQKAVTSMMDLSDGLYLDLKRLIKASGVGALIDLTKLLPTASLAQGCQALDLDPLEAMLVGGEDYSLLITLNSAEGESLVHAFKEKFGNNIQIIGEINSDLTIQLKGKGGIIPFPYKYFCHFVGDEA